MATSPNTDNYTLGKGVVFFDQEISGVYQGERDLGNAPAFSFSVSIEKLEHYSSRGGLKAKDKEIISQITPTCTFTLDEINKENLALLTLADLNEVTQSSGSATSEAVTAHVGLRSDLAYRSVSNVVVQDETDTTTYVAGTDYEVSTDLKDDVIGRIKILEGGSISEGDVLHIDYDYAEVTYTEIQAFANSQIEGKLRFVSDNPAGEDQELEIWRVSLTPSGDTAMIGDDWSTLGFTGEVLKDETGHPDSPYFNITMVG